MNNEGRVTKEGDKEGEEMEEEVSKIEIQKNKWRKEKRVKNGSN